MLQLQSNVSMPVKRPVTDRRKKYPVEKMKVGDFFFVRGKQRSSIRSYFVTLGKQHNMRLRSEQIFARDTPTGWEQCPADTPGAESGVGVWRIE